MNSTIARDIAHESHRDHRTRFGEPVVEHLARVAAAVPPQARAIAWLHDLFAKTERSRRELRERGLTRDELSALDLLTRRPSEDYIGHSLRIAYARGEAGRLARLVKLADLDDHLSHRATLDDAPRYESARRRIAGAQARHGERQSHIARPAPRAAALWPDSSLRAITS